MTEREPESDTNPPRKRIAVAVSVNCSVYLASFKPSPFFRPDLDGVLSMLLILSIPPFVLELPAVPQETRQRRFERVAERLLTRRV